MTKSSDHSLGTVSAGNVHAKSIFVLLGEGYKNPTGEILRGNSLLRAYTAGGPLAMVLYILKACSALKDDVDSDDTEKTSSMPRKGKEQTSFRIPAYTSPENKEETSTCVRPPLTFGEQVPSYFWGSSEDEISYFTRTGTGIVPTRVKQSSHDAATYSTPSS
ncbi:hypothetical protein diail_8793 [Diaporthe ilicicola]|nr:hypothetical protein diail_8793 [Diaporthe ilicicola]